MNNLQNADLKNNEEALLYGVLLFLSTLSNKVFLTVR